MSRASKLRYRGELSRTRDKLVNAFSKGKEIGSVLCENVARKSPERVGGTNVRRATPDGRHRRWHRSVRAPLLVIIWLPVTLLQNGGLSGRRFAGDRANGFLEIDPNTENHSGNTCRDTETPWVSFGF